MSKQPPADREPDHPNAASSPAPGGTRAPGDTHAAPKAPGEMTALICDQCGNERLIRVKGCWYCEKCHYKFDCYGW